MKFEGVVEHANSLRQLLCAQAKGGIFRPQILRVRVEKLVPQRRQLPGGFSLIDRTLEMVDLAVAVTWLTSGS